MISSLLQFEVSLLPVIFPAFQHLLFTNLYWQVTYSDTHQAKETFLQYLQILPLVLTFLISVGAAKKPETGDHLSSATPTFNYH